MQLKGINKTKTTVVGCRFMCLCLCSEWPHACVKRWGPVGWCDGYVQIVSDLEALRLQRHGVIRALPAGYSVADILQPAKKKGQKIV